MTEQYTVHIQQHRDENGAPYWEAWHPRLPGCRAQGATPQDAQEALDDCRRSFLQALGDCGQPIPLGDTNLGHSVVIYVHEHAGRG